MLLHRSLNRRARSLPAGPCLQTIRNGQAIEFGPPNLTTGSFHFSEHALARRYHQAIRLYLARVESCALEPDLLHHFPIR